MKPKAQTLQQRLGFLDPELTTPAHDELMIWLDGWLDTNVYHLIKEINSTVAITRKDGHRVNKATISLSEFAEKLPHVRTDNYKDFKMRKVWECAILDKNYTIGFADMLCHIEGAGEIEFNADDNKVYHYGDTLLYFEVKPSIPSLGEVIRQIRMYQTYTNIDRYGAQLRVKWFIVSPDDRFKSQIESQRIGFIHAEVNP